MFPRRVVEAEASGASCRKFDALGLSALPSRGRFRKVEMIDHAGRVANPAVALLPAQEKASAAKTRPPDHEQADDGDERRTARRQAGWRGVSRRSRVVVLEHVVTNARSGSTLVIQSLPLLTTFKRFGDLDAVAALELLGAVDGGEVDRDRRRLRGDVGLGQLRRSRAAVTPSWIIWRARTGGCCGRSSGRGLFSPRRWRAFRRASSRPSRQVASSPVMSATGTP